MLGLVTRMRCNKGLPRCRQMRLRRVMVSPVVGEHISVAQLVEEQLSNMAFSIFDRSHFWLRSSRLA